MPSDIAHSFEFAPASHGVIDSIRVRLGLWLLRQSEKASANRKRQFVESLDAAVRYDIGATDIIHESAIHSVAKYHPNVLAFGGLYTHSNRRSG